MEDKSKRVTKEQKSMLIQYLEEHKEFAHDRFVSCTGVKNLAEQWEGLAEMLNGLGGAFKNGEGWKRAWSNMRSKAKQKFQDYKNCTERSDINGTLMNYKLTDLDERIVGLMTIESVVGREEVGEPLRAARVVPDISFVNECDEPTPSCSPTHTQTKILRKSKADEFLELERQLLVEKRRKNDIAQLQVGALRGINKTMQQILKKLTNKENNK